MNSRVELLAEISTNHGGDMGLAKEFIWRFAEAGATFVKFQHTRVKHLRRDDPQYAWFQRAELTVDQFAELKAECCSARVKFATTVFNHQDVPEVLSLYPDAIKVGSGEAGNVELAKALWNQAGRLFVSLGICGTPFASPFAWCRRAEFLHCVTRYPAPAELARADYVNVPYDRPVVVGYSDHSIGLTGCQIAIECGARIVEKHVQLAEQARPARSWEATVEEFKALRAFADDDPSRLIGRWQHA